MYLYYSGTTSSPSTAIPPASSLRSIPLIEPGGSEPPLMSVPASLPTTTLVGSGSGLSTNPTAASNPLPILHTTDATPLSGPSTSKAAVTLSSALPPIPARVVEKICAGQFCEFKEMLADNIALRQTLLETGESATSLAHLREISDPLTWAFCFLAFVAVRTKDQETRELAAYGQLVIHLARQHGGTGWLAYDKRFRQHHAAGIGHPWSELNPSLMAATVLRRDSGGKPGQSCSKCASSDHEEKDCALIRARVIEPARQRPGPGFSRILLIVRPNPQLHLLGHCKARRRVSGSILRSRAINQLHGAACLLCMFGKRPHCVDMSGEEVCPQGRLVTGYPDNCLVNHTDPSFSQQFHIHVYTHHMCNIYNHHISYVQYDFRGAPHFNY